MKRLNSNVAIYIVLSFLFLMTLFNYKTTSIYKYDIVNNTIDTNATNPSSKNCNLKLWKSLIERTDKLPATYILMDIPLLNALANKTKCFELNKNYKIKIGINQIYKNENSKNNGFSELYYEDELKKDYIKFNMTGKEDGTSQPVYRIIPKSVKYNKIMNILIPNDIELFINYWKRSRFIDCLNIDMKRGESVNPKLKPIDSTIALSALRETLITFNMFSFIFGGTLLGWYRECSIIPHTLDLDVSVFAEDYNPQFVDGLLNNSIDFEVLRMFGEINDSLEFTVGYKNGYAPRTDIFFMYTDSENNTVTNWVSGVDSNGQKYKYVYPKYDPYCAGDLHNHLVWVTCSPESMLTHEYGPNWRIDHPTSKYAWNGSGKNIKKNGKWTKEQMKKLYHIY